MPVLEIQLAGWYQCRLATDPDTTWEKRGVSGYTFAIGRESDFDRVIYLQRDGNAEQPGIPDVDYRDCEDGCPARKVGVTVTAVRYQGQAWAPGALLIGAPVRLLGAQYQLWNQIVADGVERIVPIISPFDIQVQTLDRAIELRRSDPLDPEQPKAQIWQLAPFQYKDRAPTNYVHVSDAVLDALGIQASDINDWFGRRKQWLQIKIATCADAVDREAFESRLRTVVRFSESPDPANKPGLLPDRLGLQTTWSHPIRGGNAVVRGDHLLGGVISPTTFWRIRFWHGGWDGDLMRGYMSGTLTVPFEPAAT